MTRTLTMHVLCAAIAAACLAAVPAPAAASTESIGDIRDRIAETERRKLELIRTLALIYETRGEQEKAIAYTMQAFMLDASDEALAAKLLDLLRGSERWADMIPIYERLIEEHPGQSQQYLLELGTCYFKVGNEERALEVLDEYRTEYADYQETYLKLASVLADNGHMPKAAAILEEAVADKFKDHYKLHWQLGTVYIELNEIKKAIGAYEAAFNLVEPGSDRNAINSRLISLYKKADCIDEVIDERLREIEEMDAQLVESWWAEAQALERDKQLDKAIEYYRKVAALAPDSEKGKAAAAKVDELTSKQEK
jgi:tetratricopeptide (TPR) repeat protein